VTHTCSAVRPTLVPPDTHAYRQLCQGVAVLCMVGRRRGMDAKPRQAVAPAPLIVITLAPRLTEPIGSLSTNDASCVLKAQLRDQMSPVECLHIMATLPHHQTLSTTSTCIRARVPHDDKPFYTLYISGNYTHSVYTKANVRHAQQS